MVPRSRGLPLRRSAIGGAGVRIGRPARSTHGVKRRVYPGQWCVVGRLDTVLLSRGLRATHLEQPRPRVRQPDSTLWDVASLTKVVATTGVAARLRGPGHPRPRRAGVALPPRILRWPRSLVTVRMLLDHTSGLPAFIALWQVTATPGEAIARICAEPLRRPPGTRPGVQRPQRHPSRRSAGAGGRQRRSMCWCGGK